MYTVLQLEARIFVHSSIKMLESQPHIESLFCVVYLLRVVRFNAVLLQVFSLTLASVTFSEQYSILLKRDKHVYYIIL